MSDVAAAAWRTSLCLSVVPWWPLTAWRNTLGGSSPSFTRSRCQIISCPWPGGVWQRMGRSIGLSGTPGESSGLVSPSLHCTLHTTKNLKVCTLYYFASHEFTLWSMLLILNSSGKVSGKNIKSFLFFLFSVVFTEIKNTFWFLFCLYRENMDGRE